MKTLALLACSILISINAISQKYIFDNANKIGGDVVINKMYYEVSGDSGKTLFEIVAPFEDNYYLSTWICVPTENGILLSYPVIINGTFLDVPLSTKISSWQTAYYKDSTERSIPVRLKQGINIVGFASKLPLLPQADFVKLVLNKDSSYISDAKYKAFLQSIIDNPFYCDKAIVNEDTLLNQVEVIGKSAIVVNKFDETENKALAFMQKGLTETQKSDLEVKYITWKATWTNPAIAISSDPAKYAESAQYTDFLTYCKTLGTASWPFVFKKFEEGDFFVINAIQDLTLPEYQNVLDSVKATVKTLPAESVTSSNSSLYAVTLQYLKSIADLNQPASNASIEELKEANINVFPTLASSSVNVQHAFKSTVCIDLLDANGSCLYSVKNANSQESIDVSGLVPGIYFLKITDDKKIYTVKIFKN